MGTRITWAVLVVLYVIFFSWYTSFGGPLSDEEVAYYIGLVESNDPPPSPEQIARMRKFLEEDTGDDFVMFNVIDMYDTPLQVEGVEPGETSEEVAAKYMDYMWPELLSRASHPVIFGEAANTAMDLMNAEGMEEWTGAWACATAAGATCSKLRATPILRTPTYSRLPPCARPSHSPSTPGSRSGIPASFFC